ncbi:MAG TPA: alpha/beta fold hydrolase [Blastocatellia bacterium]|nr:alpha/beta fold hydrolase [Blastocatellia bacterium]
MASSSQPAPVKKKSRRWLKWLIRIAGSLLALVLIFVFFVAPYLLAGFITHAGTRPMDRALTTTPSDFGLQFKDVQFTAADGVEVSGWFIPSSGKNATIIYSHGLFRSRRELLARAADLCHLGYGALLYDSRNHGLSGKALTTLGYSERFDVEGAVAFLHDTSHIPDKIIVLGVSMGAVADLLAAAETPNISAVISDSSFASFDDTVTHHVRLFFHLPTFPIADELEYYIPRKGRFNGDALSPLNAVRTINRPILFIAGANDPRMPPSIARELYDASPNPKRDLLIVDGPGSNIHGHAYIANPAIYIKGVSHFLDTALAN